MLVREAARPTIAYGMTRKAAKGAPSKATFAIASAGSLSWVPATRMQICRQSANITRRDGWGVELGAAGACGEVGVRARSEQVRHCSEQAPRSARRISSPKRPCSADDTLRPRPPLYVLALALVLCACPCACPCAVVRAAAQGQRRRVLRRIEPRKAAAPTQDVPRDGVCSASLGTEAYQVRSTKYESADGEAPHAQVVRCPMSCIDRGPMSGWAGVWCAVGRCPMDRMGRLDVAPHEGEHERDA